MPVHEEGKPEPRGLQLWVDLPKQFKMVEPSYQELGPAGFVLHLVLILFYVAHNFLRHSVPSAYPADPEGGIEVKVISGKSHGVESPVRPLGGCWFFHAIFKKKGTIFQDIRKLSLLAAESIH